MRILVVGATGLLGAPVAERLRADGHDVRLFARDPERALARLGSGYDVAAGDVDDADSIRSALTGCQGVHVSLMGGPTEEDFDRVEHRGTARVAEIAAELGLDRLTYLSGAPAVPENAREHATAAKIRAEEAIRASGVPFTIFRVSWVMDSLSMFVRGKRAIMVGRQAHPVRFVAAADYARGVSRAYSLPEAAGKTLFIVGPEPVTKYDALRRYCAEVRPEIRFTPLPVGPMRVVAALSFNRQLRSDVRRLAFYDTIGDDFGDPAEADALLGPNETTLDEWIAQERSRRGAGAPPGGGG